MLAMIFSPSSQEKLDESLAGVWAQRLGAQRNGVTIAHKLTEPDVIQRDAFLAVKNYVLQKRDADGSLSGRDALSRRGQRFYQQGLGRGQITNEFVGPFLRAHDFVQTREPLRRGRVPACIGHDKFAAKLRLEEIFQ